MKFAVQVVDETGTEVLESERKALTDVKAAQWLSVQLGLMSAGEFVTIKALEDGAGMPPGWPAATPLPPSGVDEGEVSTIAIAAILATLLPGTNVAFRDEVANGEPTGKKFIDANVVIPDKGVGQIFWNGTKTGNNASYSQNPFTWDAAPLENSMPGTWERGTVPAQGQTADLTALRCLVAGTYKVEYTYTAANGNFYSPVLYVNDVPLIKNEANITQTNNRPGGVAGTRFMSATVSRTYKFAVGDLLRYYMSTGDNVNGVGGTVALSITRV